MEPFAFLNLAQELSRRSDSEAALRTSISRSYYALHHYLSQFILAEKFYLPKDGTRHLYVINDMYNCEVDEIRQVAKDVDNLLEERNRADYELELDTFKNQNHVILLFLRAKAAWQTFEAYTKNRENRKQIAKGIRTYRAKIQKRIN